MHGTIEARHLAVIGGLGRLAGADLHGKLVRAVADRGAAHRVRVTLERRGFDRGPGAGTEPERIGGRKVYLYDTATRLARRRADALLLPCFISHTFLAELQAEVDVPILNMMTALADHLRAEPGRLGILATRYVEDAKLFDTCFAAERLCYPSGRTHRSCIAPAMYGPDGILAGNVDDAVLERLHEACLDLLRQGADLIVPGASEMALLAPALRARGLPVLDSHQVYAEYALARQQAAPVQPFKVGIVGGIGPAATVDFMQKIIRSTGASRDQEHVRLVVDHNPQIPDRTANLVGGGRDPTLALYSACRRLEANGASVIAMPCNTAHAYVHRLQPGLHTPIVNMLAETVRHIGTQLRGHTKVGLLATTGTVASRVYHDAASGAPFELVVPDSGHQALVMDAIYGGNGVKAGHVDGPCKAALLRALQHLADAGATVVILGCTELPLVLPEHPAFSVGRHEVVLLDPTAILARKCVDLARQAGGDAH